MTLDEKIELIGGQGFSTIPNARLGIPEIKMTDGALGPRGKGNATNYSSCINMAATFDNDLIEQVGKAIGEETRGMGYDMILGPNIHIARVPYDGLTYVSYGEDPYLTSRMGVAYIKGVQNERVIADAKHLICNNQEWNRMDVDARVGERALREIYLPAFKAAVQEADVWTVMAAYNSVNGHWACENKYFLTDILKDEWGFTGFTISDWGGVHSTINTALAGMDLEMPTGKYMGRDLLKAVKNGQVDESIIDDKDRRILRVMFKEGLFNKPNKEDSSLVDTKEHRALALKVARKSIVLLKNENNFLPLKPEHIKSIAMIGPNADVARVCGGGSAELNPFYKISPLQGIKNKVGDKISIRFSRGVVEKRITLPIIGSSALIPPDAKEGEHGLLGEYFNNRDLEGKPVLTRIDKQVDFNWRRESPAPGIVNSDKFSVRWTGKLIAPETGNWELGINADNGARIFIDSKQLVDAWTDAGPDQLKSGCIDLEAGRRYNIRIEFYENVGDAMAILGMAPSISSEQTIKDAVKIAGESDIVILCAGLNRQSEGEAKDREKLELPDNQVDLINAVSRANPNIMVVLNNGTPILMNQWIDNVPAIIEAFYPGQEGGNALADIIFGDINPSGKLPLTFPKAWKDSPAYGTYPGTKKTAYYSEGIFVGYRHFDKYDIAPLFPFGHGLSYTTFEYSNLEIAPKTVAQNETVNVKMTAKNSGKMTGDDVIQLYVRDVESSLEREVKALKGFKRVCLKPGESKTVTFKLDKSSLAFYDVRTKQWVAEPGQFQVIIGSSSRDIRLNGKFELK